VNLTSKEPRTKIRHLQEYYFPSLGLFYSAISKNASTSVLATLIRFEENLRGRMDTSNSLTQHVPISPALPIDVWDEYNAMRESYLARRRPEGEAEAQRRLLILRNPARRLASAWLNKYFMLRSHHEITSGDLSKMQGSPTIEEVGSAFSSFVESLTPEVVATHADSHLALQRLYVRNLDYYTHVIGISGVQHLPEHLFGGQVEGNDEAHAIVPVSNRTPSAVHSALLTASNIEMVQRAFAEDYSLIAAASQLNTDLHQEREVKASVSHSLKEQMDPAEVEKLVQSRNTHLNKFRATELERSERKADKGRQRTANRPARDLPVALFLLCHNERVLLPHAVAHYRRYVPKIEITILDNESDDESVDLAQGLGCRVLSWGSSDQIDDHKFVTLKNSIWKGISSGWVIMADMDEWLCASQEDFAREAQAGVTVLRVYGLNMVAESDRADLSDLDLHAITQGFHMSSRDKLVAFLRPSIKEMNYGIGAHEAHPKGVVVLSPSAYVLKHFERLGLPWLMDKWKKRFNRAQNMHAEGIALHYTDDEAVIVRRQETALRHARERSLTPIPPARRRKIQYRWQSSIARIQRSFDRLRRRAS
jgi:hypothetical protein